MYIFLFLLTESTSRLSRIHPLDGRYSSRSCKRSRTIDTSGIGPPGSGLPGNGLSGIGLPGMMLPDNARLAPSPNVPAQSNLGLQKWTYNFPKENNLKWEKGNFDFKDIIVGQALPVYANRLGFIYGIANGGRICPIFGPNTRRTTVSMRDHNRHSFYEIFGPH